MIILINVTLKIQTLVNSDGWNPSCNYDVMKLKANELSQLSSIKLIENVIHFEGRKWWVSNLIPKKPNSISCSQSKITPKNNLSAS